MKQVIDANYKTSKGIRELLAGLFPGHYCQVKVSSASECPALRMPRLYSGQAVRPTAIGLFPKMQRLTVVDQQLRQNSYILEVPRELTVVRIIYEHRCSLDLSSDLFRAVEMLTER